MEKKIKFILLMFLFFIVSCNSKKVNEVVKTDMKDQNVDVNNKRLIDSGEDKPGQVLIATEKSEFKNNVVNQVLKILNDQDVKVKVVGLKDLKNSSGESYKAVIIINTIWAWNLKKPVKAYLKNIEQKERKSVVLVNTAKTPGWEKKVKGIDAVTSASKQVNIDKTVEFIISEVNKRLKNNM